jgi:hypothetical protein
MVVGVDGTVGKPMVREGQRMLIEVRRSLRDVFRKVPTMAIEVQVRTFCLARRYFIVNVPFSLLLCHKVLDLSLFYFMRLHNLVELLLFMFSEAQSYICEIMFPNSD